MSGGTERRSGARHIPLLLAGTRGGGLRSDTVELAVRDGGWGLRVSAVCRSWSSALGIETHNLLPTACHARSDGRRGMRRVSTPQRGERCTHYDVPVASHPITAESKKKILRESSSCSGPLPAREAVEAGHDFWAETLLVSLYPSL